MGSILAALPFTLLVGSLAYFAYGGHPRGDAVFYDNDLGASIEWLVRERRIVMPLLMGLATTLAVAEYGRLLPLGAALATVNQHDDQSPYTFSQALSQVAPQFARLARWVTGVRILQIIAIGAAWLACQGIRGHSPTKVRDLFCLIPIGVVAVVVSLLGVMHDCARTQLIKGETRPWASLQLRWTIRAWVAWLLFASASGILIALGWCGNQVSTRWIGLVWVVHQLLHFARSAVFTLWLRHLQQRLRHAPRTT